jgi:hypothetical protein
MILIHRDARGGQSGAGSRERYRMRINAREKQFELEERTRARVASRWSLVLFGTTEGEGRELEVWC